MVSAEGRDPDTGTPIRPRTLFITQVLDRFDFKSNTHGDSIEVHFGVLGSREIYKIQREEREGVP